jgi:hypothetical protein
MALSVARGAKLGAIKSRIITLQFVGKVKDGPPKQDMACRVIVGNAAISYAHGVGDGLIIFASHKASRLILKK